MPKQKAKREGLTARQRKFVAVYRAERNATRAAIAAGYSEKTAYSAGARLLKNVGVASALNKKLAADVEKFDIRGDEILAELRRIALSDIGQAFAADGKLKPIHEIPEDTRRAMAGLETDELWAPIGDGEGRAHIGDIRKVKFWDKLRALELLGKNLKLFTDKVEHSGNVTLEQLVAGGVDE